jgi:aldehyde:ferredoxin oxidoreductase
MHGFYNQILNIDLSTQQVNVQPIKDEIYSTYLGGKGLASWVLSENNPKGVDPLSGENHLIFATGSVTGGITWGSSRYGVFTKSPLTGLYAESYSGGRVPEAVAATGFDAIVIKGCTKDLSILEITPEGALFHNASDLAGKDTFETEDAVKEKYCIKKTKQWKSGAVVIGPAAENGVLFSIIKNDGWRCAGRAGTGTVMGSKNLKAIVFSGDKKRVPHDPKGLLKLSKELAAVSKDSPIVHAYKSMGTSQMVKIMNGANAFPTKYWSKGKAPHWEKISADALHNQCEVKPHACAKCFLSCGRMTQVQQGRHKGLTIEGPEYETIYTFGGLCMVESIEEIAYLNHVCDGLGMDTITAGNLVAFTMEAFEQGKCDYEIKFGDAEAAAKLLRLISDRKDLGETLSKGIRHTAKVFGMEDQAVHVKGMEPAGYDPRSLKGMGLAYATSDRGACHLRATFYKPELAGMIDPAQIEGKAKLFIDFEDRLTLFDSMILCKFFRDIYPWDLLGELIEASTGVDGSEESLRTIAGAISSKVREFNLQEGMTKEDEQLPKAFHKKLQDSGGVIKKEEIDQLLKDYNALRNWKK